MNSQASSVRAWRRHRSTILACYVHLREIGRRHETDLALAPAEVCFQGQSERGADTAKQMTRFGLGHSRTSAHNCAIEHSASPNRGVLLDTGHRRPPMAAILAAGCAAPFP